MAKIVKIAAREILSSRGLPTVEVVVFLDDGSFGAASSPAGPKKTDFEALEKRDNSRARYMGQGVLDNIIFIRDIIAPHLIGKDAPNPVQLDQVLNSFDQSEKKAKVGVNTIFPISVAITKAIARSFRMPLWVYFANWMGFNPQSLRIPALMVNLINGGKLGYDNVDFKEYLIIPSSTKPYSQSIEIAVEIFQTLKQKLLERHTVVPEGLEGGISPQFFNNADALSILVETVNATPYHLGKDAFLAVDVDASSFRKQGGYKLRDFPQIVRGEDLIEYYTKLIERFRLLSIEDPLDNEDWESWSQLNSLVSGQVLITADTLVSANLGRLSKTITKKAANALVVKPILCSTVTQTIIMLRMAKDASLKTIISHRFSDTNDDFLADLAVGTASDFVKFGAPQRGEHIAKYNRLLTIENQLFST